MDEEKTPKPVIERWLNKDKYATVKVIGAGFAFVWLLGVLFSIGEQIYPVFPNFPPGTECPECAVLNDITCQITERQFRITYEPVSPLALSRNSAWRLLRIRVFGEFFDQEMRPVDNGGVYSLGKTHSALHYELNQEGETRVELWCLDMRLREVTGTVSPWNRATKHSIIHKNKRVTNACLKNGAVLLFTKSNIRSVKNGTWLGNTIAFERLEMEEYAKDLTTGEKGFVFTYTPEEITAMNARELFEKILVVAFTQSHFGETVMFQNTTGIPDSLLSVVKKVTERRFTSEQASCYNHLNFQADLQRAGNLSQPEHLMMKRVVAQKYETGADKIVMTHIPIGDEIRRAEKDVVELDPTDIKGIIKNVSTAKAMIAYDDNDQVIHAFWLPEDSPLILIVPPRRKIYSDAVTRLQKAGKKIIFVEGDVEGATSDNTELLRKCLAGELDVDGPECADSFSNVAFKANIERVVEIVRDPYNN